jgi:hypothetical protein
VVVGVAVGALVLPLVVMAIRVIAHDWPNPGGDLALIELRTRDVGLHMPLLGSYGRYGFNQPGPLWFYVLAVPYRLFGSRYAALQLGVLGVNAAAVAAIVVVARRRGGLVPMLLVAVLLGVLMYGLGAQWLADPWEPHGLTLLCAALLFLTWDAAVGGRVTLVATVVVAALLAEAQAGLALFALGMVAVAVVGTILRIRREGADAPDRRDANRWLVIAGAAVVVLLVPPVLALGLKETGNLADLLRSMRHPAAPFLGLSSAWRAVAVELGHNAPWLGSEQPLAAFSTTVDVRHISPVPFGLLVFVAVGALALRARARVSTFFVVVGVGILSAVVSLARLLGPLFFWIPEWTRVLGFGCWVAVLWATYEFTRTREWWRSVEPFVIAVLTAGLIVASTAGTIDAARAEPLANPSVDAVHRLARAALPEVRDGASLVTASVDRFQVLGSDPGTPTLVLDLERAGADVVVDSSAADHFGDHRAQPERAVRELRLLTDADPVPEGFRVLAVQDPLSPEQRATRTRLLAQYPELGSNLSPGDRLRLVQSRPDLREAARQLDAIPALPVLTLAVRPLP